MAASSSSSSSVAHSFVNAQPNSIFDDPIFSDMDSFSVTDYSYGGPLVNRVSLAQPTLAAALPPLATPRIHHYSPAVPPSVNSAEDDDTPVFIEEYIPAQSPRSIPAISTTAASSSPFGAYGRPMSTAVAVPLVSRQAQAPVPVRATGAYYVQLLKGCPIEVREKVNQSMQAHLKAFCKKGDLLTDQLITAILQEIRVLKKNKPGEFRKILNEHFLAEDEDREIQLLLISKDQKAINGAASSQDLLINLYFVCVNKGLIPASKAIVFKPDLLAPLYKQIELRDLVEGIKAEQVNSAIHSFGVLVGNLQNDLNTLCMKGPLPSSLTKELLAVIRRLEKREPKKLLLLILSDFKHDNRDRLIQDLLVCSDNDIVRKCTNLHHQLLVDLYFSCLTNKLITKEELNRLNSLIKTENEKASRPATPSIFARWFSSSSSSRATPVTAVSIPAPANVDPFASLGGPVVPDAVPTANIGHINNSVVASVLASAPTPRTISPTFSAISYPSLTPSVSAALLSAAPVTDTPVAIANPGVTPIPAAVPPLPTSLPPALPITSDDDRDALA